MSDINKGILNPSGNKYSISVTSNDTSVLGKVKTEVNNIQLLSTNNYPLYQGTLPDGSTPPPTTTTNPTIDSNLANALSGATHEELRKNIASYPHSINNTDKKYVIVTYTTSATTSIIVTTDMRTTGKIVITISGDVPSGVLLTKTITMDASYNIIDVVYS